MRKVFLKLAVQLCLPLLFFASAAPGATVTWIGGSGDWTNKTHWSTGSLPGVNDDVVISLAATITVTHSAGTHTVNSIQSRAAFVLSGGVLAVANTFQASNTITLTGGTLQTATVVATNGASLIVSGSGGTLNGVTVNGVLDVGNSYNNASLTVTNNLTLNGIALVGNPTNSNYGVVNFGGTQALGGNGTVVFGDYIYAGIYYFNSLRLSIGGTTLTLGPDITIHGQNGVIGYSSNFGGPQNVSVINRGIISSDVSGATINIYAQPFSNQELAQGINGGNLYIDSLQNGVGGIVLVSGGTLTLTGTWTNSGTLVESGGTLDLGGSFSLAGLGTLNRTNGSVNLTGMLNNTNTTLALNATTGPWVFAGGEIQGGTIAASSVAPLIISSGTLDGVTVNGSWDVGSSVYGAQLTVLDGLTNNGMLQVGNPTNSNIGVINFSGTQTLGGTGTVMFGSFYNAYPIFNSLQLVTGGTTLTIGSGLTVRGQNGTIGYSSHYGGPQNVSVVNQGTISCDVSNGTIAINAQPFTNQGLAQGVNSGTLMLNGTWINNGTLVESGGTLDLGGSFNLGDVGTLNHTNGMVGVTGMLNNTNTTLVLNAATGPWVLAGGDIQGGTISASSVAPLIISSGTLDGVTINGNLDVGSSVNGAQLTVLDGLTNNGTLLLGNPTNSNYGVVNFNGTQTLGGTGTVVFGDYVYAGTYYYNSLRLSTGGTALAIGPGITIHGQKGVIGYNVNFGGPQNVSVINQGVISSDVSGGMINIYAQPFSNYGLAQVVNGGSLTLNSTWINSGSLVESSGTLNLGGIFSWTDLGTLNRTNGTVNVTGTLNNTNTTLALNTVTGPWVLAGGDIQSGTIVASSAAPLIISSGTLDGVTVNGSWDVGSSVGGAQLTVLDGLTNNGTMQVGNPTNSNYGGVNFNGTQTLGGTGTVVFGDNNYNALRLPTGDTALTIGSGLTIVGQNGAIGYSRFYSGPQNVSVVNQGTIACEVSGGTINIQAQPLESSGTLEAFSGSTLNISQISSTAGNITAVAGGTVILQNSVFLNGNNVLVSQAGGTIEESGSVLGSTKNIGQFSPLGTLILNGSGTSSSPQLMEVMGEDYGTSAVGFIHNFGYGTIELANSTYVELVNQFQNSGSSAPEALYVNSLIIPSGTTLNMNGFHVYARALQIGGAVLNGTVTQIPNSGSIGFSTPSLGDITGAGQLDQWTFFARAGQFYTVLVDPGTDIGISPNLDYVQVRVFNTNGVIVASATNTTRGASVLLSSIAMTNDGIYSVQVQASPVALSSTGYYQVTVWPATPNIQALTFNQTVSGSILTPYSVDQWTFGASVNQQVSFNLVNISQTGVSFDLYGPNGWLGFTNITTSSGLITLPDSGNYYVEAHSQSGQYSGYYAFELVPTALTNLTLGTPIQEQFSTSGQAQLFEFNIPASTPLGIGLQNLVVSNQYEIYASLGHPPTRASYDYHAGDASVPNQHMIIPLATSGIWYVLVYADNIQTPGNFTLTASAGAVILFSVAPSSTGISAPSTLILTGAGFDSSSSVQFIDSSNNAHQATSISVDSFTQLTVNEAAGALSPGNYSIRISLASGASGTLSNAFVVLSKGAPNLLTTLALPGIMGRHEPATIFADYGNSGDAAMLAPLLILTANQNGVPGAILTLDSSLVVQGLNGASTLPNGLANSEQFLGFGQTPGMLQPGESFQVPVYYAGWEKPWDFVHNQFNWTLGVIQATDPTPIDWSAQEFTLEPATIPADAWNAIWMSYTNDVGTTWGGYVTLLDNNAAYLGRLGVNVQDISKLLAFQFMQDDGLCPLRTLASSVDASVPAPGLPLTFSRSFGEPISQRFAKGPLGRGWSHNWQYSLSQGSDGTITIFGPSGSERVFQPDTRGGWFAQAGDYGTLATAAGGAYTLTEKTGLQYYYQANGTLGYLQDLNNNRITLGYTGGLLTRLTHSSGQFIHIGYNPAGLISTLTDNYGHQTVLSYDAANQHLTDAQFFDGRTATYTYNTTGSSAQLHELTGVTSSCCNWRYFTYDPFGRLTGTYLGGNAESLTFTYGTGGQVNVTDALTNVTQFFYDNNGLLTKTVDGNGNAVHLAFDANYNLVSVTDPAGRSYNYGYDGEGNVISSTDPLANQTQFSFTSAYNRLASVTDAKGNPTKYSYDPYGNLEVITYADGSAEDWSYDDYGNPQTWTNRRDHQTFYTFNNNGQVTGKYFADGSVTSYAYDSLGNLTNAATFDTELNPLESSTLSYDASNRLTQITYPGGKFLNFTYDATTGRRTSSVDQLGHQLTYYYDVAGRLASMTNELGTLVVAYQYDPAGRVATKTLGNGMFTLYQYDPAGQLLTLTNALAKGSLLSSFNYTYDSRGRRTTMATLDGNWTYTYDDLGQLTHAVYAAITTNVPNQDLTYIYDAVGNRTQTIENGLTNTYTANHVNQYVSVGQTNYTFDADGNLIKEVSPLETTTYTYNDENRLISLTSPQGTWQYTYDGLENRTVITANDAATRDVVDPIDLGNIVGEYDSSGNIIAHYDHALGLLTRSDGSADLDGYTFDGIGNVQQVVSSAGTILNSYSYRSFGGLMRNSAVIPNPFQFNGEFGVMADNNGLKFMRNRFYSTAIGRFETQDPLGLAGNDVNFYRYAQNAPTFLIDPDGEDWGINFRLGVFAINYVTRNQLLSFGVRYQPLINEINALIPKVFTGFTHVPLIPSSFSNPLGTWVGKGNILLQSFWFGFNAANALNLPSIVNGWLYNYYLNSFLSQNNLPTFPSGTVINGTTGVAKATDPNQMTGPAGYGANGFIASSSTLAYRIDFENETNATAPAQQVVISDQLSTNFDWTTFNVSEFGFGDLVFSLPPGIQQFQTNENYSYLGTNFQVQVQIGINLASGLVSAAFHSIDPATSLPPPVNIGFLPPEDGTGRGQGHVTYTIHAKAGLPTGTELENVALISFDNQPQIATDQLDDSNPAAGIDQTKEALITLDAVPPMSEVLPLPAQSQLLQFPVAWSGQELTNGPGIASYNIYVSDNGSSWTLWQSATTATNATFSGQAHRTYGFTSQAIDNAGLTEAQHPIADAITTVVANPLLFLSVTPAVTNLNVGDTYTYSLVVSNLGSLNLLGVSLSNSVPDGLDIDSASIGHGSLDIEDAYIDWTLGNLNTNKGASMVVSATIESAGTWTNRFTVADSQGAAYASASQIITVSGFPTITIALRAGQVILTWSTAAGNYVLQTTPSLAPASTWTTVTNAPAPSGGLNSITLPINNTQQYFRLQSQ